MLFFALIFNEIIEINLCRLSKNTINNIANRAKNDSEDDSTIERDETIESLIEIKNLDSDTKDG